MAEWSGALSPGREAHAPVSPESATPVTPWETPWSNNYQQQLLLGHENQPTPCNRQPQPLSSSSRQRSFRDGGQDSLLRERELERGQRRLRQQHYRRQTSLNLLEVRSINRALDQRQLEARGEIAELRQEQAELRDANHALRADLREARAFLEHVRDAETKLSEALTKQVTKLSAALTKQVSLLISEKERRRNADKGLERCQAALAEARGVSIHTNNTRVTDCFHSSSFASSADKGNASISSRSGSTDGSHSSIYGGSCRSIERSAFSSATPIEPPLPAAAAGSKHGRGCLPLREVLEGAKLSLAGTMGRWLKGMHAACSPEVRRALILPWVLHKLFYLSTELIDARREELRSNFVGGVLEGVDREESAYLTAGLPLSGDNLRTAIHNIMMALARRCVMRHCFMVRGVSVHVGFYFLLYSPMRLQ